MTAEQDQAMASFAEWLNRIDSVEGFRPEPNTPHQEAFNHLWEGCAILFREGHSAAGVVHLLGDVLGRMETDDEEKPTGD